jgi:hypothetical protein
MSAENESIGNGDSMNNAGSIEKKLLFMIDEYATGITLRIIEPYDQAVLIIDDLAAVEEPRGKPEIDILTSCNPSDHNRVFMNNSLFETLFGPLFPDTADHVVAILEGDKLLFEGKIKLICTHVAVIAIANNIIVFYSDDATTDPAYARLQPDLLWKIASLA